METSESGFTGTGRTDRASIARAIGPAGFVDIPVSCVIDC